MIIQVKSLRGHKGESISFANEFDWPTEKESPAIAESLSSLSVSGTVTNTGDSMYVQGSLEWSVKLRCSRCLESYEHLLQATFDEEFFAEGLNRQRKRQPEQDEEAWDIDEKSVYHGDELDLSQLLWDAVLLAVPMKTLCQPECQGLCPTCGCSLNHGQCSCTSHNTDPRLAGLADLLKE